MEDLIKQIEALKRNGMGWEDYNQGLTDALIVLKSKTVIKAKALRKQGTDEYYAWHGLIKEWLDNSGYFSVFTDNRKKKEIVNLPKDAEFIDIEIIIKESEETK